MQAAAYGFNDIVDPAAALEQFLTKCIPEPNTGCWIWEKSLAKSGYGQTFVAGKVGTAHRASYILHKKTSIPDGLCVLHRCDNRWCVNPEHLFLGTHKDNADDMVSKGRNVYTRPSLRLTDEQVRDIRYSYPRETTKQLAVRHGVHQGTIQQLVRGSSRPEAGGPLVTGRKRGVQPEAPRDADGRLLPH